MKRISKFLGILLIMALVMSMGIMAWADDTTGGEGGSGEGGTTPVTGTITVDPNYAKQEYTLYQLFDAVTVAGRTDGAEGISYKLMSGKTDLKATVNGTEVDGAQWFSIDDAGNITIKDDTAKTALAGIGNNSTAAATRDAFIAWAKAYGVVKGTKTAASDNDASVKFENLPEGYYFLTTTTGSLISLDSIMPNMKVADKNSPPSVDKEIVSTTSGVVGNDPNKTTETDTGTNEAATAKVGDTVTYKVTVKAKAGAENYVVTDTLSAGLTPPAASGVTVTGLTVTNDYTVSVSGQVITVTFTKTYLDSITQDTDLVINYSAVLNDKAVVGQAGNPNTVKLTWGHDNDDNYSEDDAKVYTAKITVIKKDGSSKGLAGAIFALKNSAGKYYKFNAASTATEGQAAQAATVTWVDKVDDATKFTSGSDGKLDGEFTGLPNGNYTLEEVKAPDGYNEVNPNSDALKFTIKDNDYTDANLIQSTTVINNAGTELPSTGGIGTTIFYVVGSILVVAAGVLLITKKRMSREG